jgi:hypothetical protein
MRPTHELLRDAIPTRAEKRRMMRQLGFRNESLLYRWCQDPAASGTRNPLDCVEAVVAHAAVHHPDAALAIVRHIETLVEEPLRRRGAGLRAEEVVLSLHPGCEREMLESVQAFTRALRQLVLSGTCDLAELLKEIQDAGRVVRTAEVMLQAVIEAQAGQAHSA